MIRNQGRPTPSIVTEVYESANVNLERLLRNWETHFEWLNEIVIEASNTFTSQSSEPSLLPRTPGRRKRKQPARTKANKKVRPSDHVPPEDKHAAVCNSTPKSNRVPASGQSQAVRFSEMVKHSSPCLLPTSRPGPTTASNSPMVLCSMEESDFPVSTPTSRPEAVETDTSSMMMCTPTTVFRTPTITTKSVSRNDTGACLLGPTIASMAKYSASKNSCSANDKLLIISSTPVHSGTSSASACSDPASGAPRMMEHTMDDDEVFISYMQDRDKRDECLNTADATPQMSTSERIEPRAVTSVAKDLPQPEHPVLPTALPRKGPTFAKPVNLVTTVSSFISKQSPCKESHAARIQKLKEDMIRKEKLREKACEEKELRQQRETAEKKKKREERERRVAQLQKLKEERELEKKRMLLSKTEHAKENEERARKLREKEEEEKRKQRQFKMASVEERRHMEEAERLRRATELLEEESRREGFMQRKAEYEHHERMKKLAEQKKQDGARLEELEKERQLAEIKKRQEIEEKTRRREEAVKEQRERVEQERRHQEAAAKVAKHAKKVIDGGHSKTYLFRSPERPVGIAKPNPIPQPAKVASTPPVSVQAKSDSYDMTPVRESYVSYDINDLSSGDSTDDDDKPSKRVPNWAKANALRTALLDNRYDQLDPDVIFIGCLEPPDLEVIFARKRARYCKRTSSACWGSPLVKKNKAATRGVVH